MRSEHTSALNALKHSHTTAIAAMVGENEAALANLTRQNEASLLAQQESHTSALEDARSLLVEESEKLRREASQLSEEKEEMATRVSTLQEELTAMSRERDDLLLANADLQKRMSERGASDEEEVDKLKRSLETVKQNEEMLSTELQEALDALGTLEKALIESQDERERLMDDLREQRQIASTVSDPEKEALKAEVVRLGDFIKRMSGASGDDSNPLTSAATPVNHLRTLGLDEDTAISKEQATEILAQTSSTDNTRGPHLDNATGLPGPNLGHRTSTTSLSHPPLGRHSSVVSLMQVTSPKAPPTPPPTMPPPPLPAEALQQLNSVSSPMTSNNGSSSSSAAPPVTATNSSSSFNTRSSISSVFTKDSHAGEFFSNTYSHNDRTNSVMSADTISVDPRVHQKLEEQEGIIGKLTKQLTHCETELKANLDLVATLESALNDYERNVRKSRLQMNELAKERDSFQQQNDSLRHQLREIQREADTAKRSLVMQEEESRQRLELQRKAQRDAQANAELRMSEMQKINRKSKFNVRPGSSWRAVVHMRLLATLT